MAATSPGGDPNDGLLVGWKEIAACLKCSVRKAQRMEALGLPVRRIPGAKSVWAAKPEIRQWLMAQAEKVQKTERSANSPGGRAQEEARAIEAPAASRRRWVFGIFIGLATGATISSLASTYGLTIFLFGLTAVYAGLMHPWFPDARYTRSSVACFLTAGLAYTAGATSLPNVMDSVINLTALPPAFVYPFAAGLRFIPIPGLIAIFLTATAIRGGSGFSQCPCLRLAYLGAGGLLLLTTALGGLAASGAPRIWQAGLPIRWTLLAGEAFILGVNLVLFVLAYRFFNAPSATPARVFFSRCAAGALLAVLAAAIVSRHWHDIDTRYLDVRQPEAYRVRNPNAIRDLQAWLRQHAAEVEPRLLRLADDPDFLNALQSRDFHRQDFDEVFQTSRKAVIFGYKAGDARDTPDFVRVRFPADLAATLRFERTAPPVESR